MEALQKLPLLVLLIGIIAFPVLAQKPAPRPATKKVNQKKAKPYYFGMTVMESYIEKCCSDTPGEQQPTGYVGILAHSMDNWYFSLSCLPRLYSPYDKDIKAEAELTDEQKKMWSDIAVGSFEETRYGKWMHLYRGGDLSNPEKVWEEVGDCQILGRIENASDIFGVVVKSSLYVPSKKGSGYSVNAFTTSVPINTNVAGESLTLWCLQNGQQPCASAKPGFYYGVRNGSQLRLCDGDFKLIATFQIISEEANGQ